MNKEIKVPISILISIGVIIILIIIYSVVAQKMRDKRYEEEELEDLNEIEFVVPDELEKGIGSSYSYYKDGMSCYLSINSYDKYDEEFSDWFKSSIIIRLSDKVSEIEEKNINDNKMLLVNVNNGYSSENHYGIESKNHYYKIVFRLNDNNGEIDRDSNPCYGFENSIISSIKIK